MAARSLAGLRRQLPYSPLPNSHRGVLSVLLRAWYGPGGQAVRQRHSWSDTTDRAPSRSTGRSTVASGQGRGHTARRPVLRPGGMSARVGQVNHAAINKELCDAKGCEALLRLVERNGRDFNAVNVATCFNRLSMLPRDEHTSVLANPRFLQLINLAELVLQSKPKELTPQVLAGMLDGLASIGHASEVDYIRLFVNTCVATEVEDFKPQNLAHVIKGVCKVEGLPEREFWGKFVDACEAVSAKPANPGARAGGQRKGPKKQEEHPRGPLLELLVDACMATKLVGFTPQDLSMVIHGLAKLNYHPGGAFLERLAGACMAGALEGLSPQQLVTIISGLGRSECNPGEPFLRSFTATCLERGLHMFTLPGLNFLIKGLARLNYRPDQHFTARFMEAYLDGQAQSPQSLVMPLSSAAHLCMPMDLERWELAMESAMRFLSGRVIVLPVVTSVLWAASVYDRLGEASTLEFIAAFRDLLRGSSGATLDLSGASGVLSPTLPQAMYILDPELDARAYKLLTEVASMLSLAEVPPKVVASRFQRNVGRVLIEGLGLRVEDEKVLGGGAISVDALILPPEGSGLAPIAVEVDGPHHYFVNHEKVPTGTTMFKRRLLDLAVQRGELKRWVCLPYWAWGSRKTKPNRRQVLRKLLEEHGVRLESYRQTTQ